MTDKRELILSRCEAILTAMVPDVLTSAHRNRDGVEALPGIKGVMLDGDEVVRLATRGHAEADGGTPPHNLLTILPEFWILREPAKNIKNENAGPAYSALRIAFLKRFLFDDELLALLDCDSGGQIEYLGFETDLRNQHPMLGVMRIDLGLTYLFDPDDL